MVIDIIVFISSLLVACYVLWKIGGMIADWILYGKDKRQRR